MLVSFVTSNISKDQPVAVLRSGTTRATGSKPPERVEPVHHFQGRNPHYGSILREQAGAWREANALRQYCDALERRCDATVGEEGADVESARAWLRWARDFAEAIDPLGELPPMPSEPELTPDDLKPYLGRWSPHGPEAHRSPWASF